MAVGMVLYLKGGYRSWLVWQNPLVNTHHPRRCLNFWSINSSFYWGLTIGMMRKYMLQDGVHASKHLYQETHCVIYQNLSCPPHPFSHFSLSQEPKWPVLPRAKQMSVSLRLFCPHLEQITYSLIASMLDAMLDAWNKGRCPSTIQYKSYWWNAVQYIIY